MGMDITAGDLVVPVDCGESELRLVEETEDGLAEQRGSTLALRTQRGMVSAEWAVGIVAAVALAGVLLAVITGGQVQDALLKFILWVIKSFVTVVS
jgi:Protein of unknown function (DUF4244)